MDIERIIQDMTSRDVDKIRISGLEIIRNSQNEEQIKKLIPYRDSIYKSTRNLDLGGAFAPNSRFYEFPLEIIDYHSLLDSQIEKSGKCTCDLYLKSYETYDPNREKDNFSMTLFAKAIGDYTFVYGMRCEKCKKRFHISERHYHYVWYKWESLTEDINAPSSSNEIDNALKLYLDIIYTALNTKSHKKELKFHQDNLTYYRNRLLQDENTKDYESKFNWTDLIQKAYKDLENNNNR